MFNQQSIFNCCFTVLCFEKAMSNLYQSIFTHCSVDAPTVQVGLMGPWTKSEVQDEVSAKWRPCQLYQSRAPWMVFVDARWMVYGWFFWMVDGWFFRMVYGWFFWMVYGWFFWMVYGWYADGRWMVFFVSGWYMDARWMVDGWFCGW